MGLAEDFLAVLQNAGLCDSGTGWTGAVDWMPPEVLADPSNNALPVGDPRRDQVVLVTGYGGSAPSNSTGPGRVGYDEPSLQIRVRASAEDLVLAKAKIDAIDAALRPIDAPITPFDGSAATYLWIKARQSEAMFLGMDAQNDRPEFSRNYDVGRRR